MTSVDTQDSTCLQFTSCVSRTSCKWPTSSSGLRITKSWKQSQRWTFTSSHSASDTTWTQNTCPCWPPRPAPARGSSPLRLWCSALVTSPVSDGDGHPAGDSRGCGVSQDPIPHTYPAVQATEESGGPGKAPLSLHLSGIRNFIQEETHRTAGQQSSVFIGSVSNKHHVLICTFPSVCELHRFPMCRPFFMSHPLSYISTKYPPTHQLHFNYLAFKLSL